MTLSYRDLSITAKVALAPLFVGLCLLVSAVSSYVTNQRTGGAVRQIATQGLPNVIGTSALQESIVQAYALLMQSVAYDRFAEPASRRAARGGLDLPRRVSAAAFPFWLPSVRAVCVGQGVALHRKT